MNDGSHTRLDTGWRDRGEADGGCDHHCDRQVYDPEIPVNIYELGLIYAVEIADNGAVKVEMTLTAPACPSAQELPEQVHNAVMTVPGVTSCDVETVWDPPWDPSRMTEEARLQLNMF